jgi:hypothetical protein
MGMQVADDIKRYGSYLSENVTPYNNQVQEELRQLSNNVGAFTYQRQLVGESILKLKVNTQAMVLSFENGFRWTAFAMALGFILVLILKKPKSSAVPLDAH